MGILNRFYSDYLLPPRWNAFERIITYALEKNYLHITLPDFYIKTIDKDHPIAEKIFLHRHDIDTDSKTARKLFEIEKKYGIKSSYYFRRSTFDFKLMNEIKDYGSEVGYHFEELSTFCKKKAIKSKNELTPYYPEICEAFKRNLSEMEKKVGFKIKSIASHGDFINRLIGVPNHAFISRDIMNECGILFECYDPVLINSYTSIISDTTYPNFYKPVSPETAIELGSKTIHFLTHPRHWNSSLASNTNENLTRFWEGIKFKIS